MQLDALCIMHPNAMKYIEVKKKAHFLSLSFKDTHAHTHTKHGMRHGRLHTVWDPGVLNFFFLQIYILQHPTPFSKQISIAYGT